MIVIEVKVYNQIQILINHKLGYKYQNLHIIHILILITITIIMIINYHNIIMLHEINLKYQ